MERRISIRRCVSGVGAMTEAGTPGRSNISPARNAHEHSEPFSEDRQPRDGMSPESVKLIVRGCEDNREYEIHGVENKGRYYIAKIFNSRGRLVNELLVDKLNGRVQFLRGR